MGNQKKYELLENFDPWPAQYRGTAKDHLHPLLNKVRGKSLCISLLHDESCQTGSKAHLPVDTKLPSTGSLLSCSHQQDHY